MASTRQPKWDWQAHLPKMRELYDLRMSIPDIHEAIQCEGFKPCLSSVYAKFRSLGYPTNPVGRTRLLDAMSPHVSETQPTEFMQGIEFDESANHQSPNLYENVLPPASEHFPSERPFSGAGLDGSTSLSGQRHQYASLDEQVTDDQLGAEDHRQEGATHLNEFQTTQPDIHPGTRWDPPPNATGIEDWQAYEFRTPPEHLLGIVPFRQEQTSAHFNPENPQAFDHGMELQFNTTPYLETPQFNNSNHELTFFNHQSNEQLLPTPGWNRSCESLNYSSTSRSSNSIKKLRSLFQPRSVPSSRTSSKYASSRFTAETGDSGYVSDYTSSTNLEDIPSIDPESLEEFNGLYRVACSTLHEPSSKAQMKDVPTCDYCRYSSIHNLAWCARYLKLEVFSAELQLKNIYDIGALDATGNTALHYAAASGAGFKYLKALIDAGVDPKVANTAGELFVYCLQPLQPYALEPNSDCFEGDDLSHLFEFLKPRLNFGWRDINGQTIMHALASKVVEPCLKDKISKIFDDVGYHATVLDRFGRTAAEVVPLAYDYQGQVINHFTGLQDAMRTTGELEVPTTCSGLNADDQPLRDVKKTQFYTIAKACENPRYIDAETGDNVIHALSKLKSMRDVLKHLEHFVQENVDLNLHNREGQSPLISFVCNRSSEGETGATMSKYLDKILWKNTKKRDHNNINVNMKDRKGATALHYAAVRGQPDSTRSLIEAGANVNTRLDNGLSILQATFDALNQAKMDGKDVQVHLYKEVISHLEHAGAVHDPTSLQERGVNNL